MRWGIVGGGVGIGGRGGGIGGRGCGGRRGDSRLIRPSSLQRLRRSCDQRADIHKRTTCWLLRQICLCSELIHRQLRIKQRTGCHVQVVHVLCEGRGIVYSSVVHMCPPVTFLHCETGRTNNSPVSSVGMTNASVSSIGMTNAHNCRVRMTDAPNCRAGMTNAPSCSVGMTDAPIRSAGMTNAHKCTQL